MTYDEYKEYGRDVITQVPFITPERAFKIGMVPSVYRELWDAEKHLKELDAKDKRRRDELRKLMTSERSEAILKSLKSFQTKGEKSMGRKTQAMARRMAAAGGGLLGGIGGGGLLSGFFDQFPEGFFVNLFTAWLTSMFGCELPTDGASAKAVCQRNYNGDGRYKRRFFARAARGVRQEAAKLGDPLTRKQSHAVTQIGLDDIRNGDDQEMSQIIFEQRSLSR